MYNLIIMILDVLYEILPPSHFCITKEGVHL